MTAPDQPGCAHGDAIAGAETHRPTDWRLAVSLNDLGLVYHEAGLHAAAEEALGRALTVWEAVEGPDHPGVATTLNNLGEVYRHRGKLDEAEYVLTRALEIRETRLEPGHVETAGPDR